MTPVSSARGASAARFWFCGSAVEPERSNSCVSVPLTVSTVSTSSSAICSVGRRRRVAPPPQRAAERDEHAPLRGRHRDHRRRPGAPCASGRATRRRRAPERDQRPADRHDVAAAQPAAAVHALAVDPRAVVGQALVAQRPSRRRAARARRGCARPRGPSRARRRSSAAGRSSPASRPSSSSKMTCAPRRRGRAGTALPRRSASRRSRSSTRRRLVRVRLTGRP